MLKIGIPKETKALEGRVALIPEACHSLLTQGFTVFVESAAGVASGYSDEDYRRVGVTVVEDAPSLYRNAELIVKVKEPMPWDLQLLEPQHQLFCYLHLAANHGVARALLDIGLVAYAFESLEKAGRLPLLEPMSQIAGYLATQIGADLLMRHEHGKGIILSGMPGTQRGKVTVLGAGSAGIQAAKLAANMGAKVTVFDLQTQRLQQIREMDGHMEGLFPYPDVLAAQVVESDLLIGAVLIPNRRAPVIVSKTQVEQMQAGSVIVDISIDQGGCIETSKATAYDNPTYQVADVTHFAVTNMPGAVPKTASQALSAVILPYVQQLALQQAEPALQAACNLRQGRVMNPALEEELAGIHNVT